MLTGWIVHLAPRIQGLPEKPQLEGEEGAQNKRHLVSSPALRLQAQQPNMFESNAHRFPFFL